MADVTTSVRISLHVSPNQKDLGVLFTESDGMSTQGPDESGLTLPGAAYGFRGRGGGMGRIPPAVII